MDSTPRLSCEQCRRRKIKCDKEAPCSSCMSAGLRCNVVQRARLPRGKSGKVHNKSSALETRVARIEALLKQAQSGGNGGETIQTSPQRNEAVNPTTVGGFVAPDFWTALSLEVSSLRETLELEEEKDYPESPVEENAHDRGSNLGALLFHHSPTSRAGLDAPSPLPVHTREILLEMYRTRSECLDKIGHWTSIAAEIRVANSNTQDTPRSPSLLALEYAVYFISICTMTDDETERILLAKKSDLIIQYRSAAEWTIARANLLRNPELPGLQAFILYLQAIRTCGQYTTSWTLVGLAIRIAQALGLGTDHPARFSPFESEVRRRVWYYVNMIDAQASLDRGTPLLIDPTALGPSPSDIDDEAMSQGLFQKSRTQPSSPPTWYNCTLDTAIAHRKMCDPSSDWTTKLQVVTDYSESIERQYLQRPPTTPFEKLTYYGANNLKLTLQLLLRRPPYKQMNDVPPSDNFDSMSVSTEVIEAELRLKDPELAPWVWKEWPPWYALAVILAELCRKPTGADAQRAWEAAQEFHRRYSRPPTDPELGVLWKPINKLMRRIQRERSPAPTPEVIVTQPPKLVVPGGCDSSRGLDVIPGVTGRFNHMYMAESQQLSANMAWQPTDKTFLVPVSSTVPLVSSAPLADEFKINMDLYNGLDPANGVSWLNWDLLLDDTIMSWS